MSCNVMSFFSFLCGLLFTCVRACVVVCHGQVYFLTPQQLSGLFYNRTLSHRSVRMVRPYANRQRETSRQQVRPISSLFVLKFGLCGTFFLYFVIFIYFSILLISPRLLLLGLAWLGKRSRRRREREEKRPKVHVKNNLKN